MLCILLASPVSGPRAWNGAGHRTISCLALATTDLEAAPWLAAAKVHERILFQSNEADRLRSRRSPALRHINEAEHYFEVDQLGRLGLTLHTVPPLRRAYLRAIVVSEAPGGETAQQATAPQTLLAGPGFLAHAMAEHQELLVAALHQVRILEILDDPRREIQLEQSRADVIHVLGRLSHLVGDGSQPLHTTRHFNGWNGVNPHGFTRSKAFHRLVDSRPGYSEALSCAALASRLWAPASKVEEAPGDADRSRATENAWPVGAAAPGAEQDTWDELLAYLANTHAQVKPLYSLEREGLLSEPAGNTFIADRLLAGAAMLRLLLHGALQESQPISADITRFTRQVKRPPRKEKPPAGKEPGRRHD